MLFEPLPRLQPGHSFSKWSQKDLGLVSSVSDPQTRKENKRLLGNVRIKKKKKILLN